MLSRLIREDPAIWDVVEARLDELEPLVLEVANETFAGYRPIPFDLPILVPSRRSSSRSDARASRTSS